MLDARTYQELSNLKEKCWEIAEEKGWHDKHRSFGDLIALCHSELSEALEEFRKHGLDPEFMMYTYASNMEKPEGIAVELADLLIRIFDMSRELNIPIFSALDWKMDYNKTREYRHGNKRL